MNDFLSCMMFCCQNWPVLAETGVQHSLESTQLHQCADICWIMAYDHKTQSFMKNGVQQKLLG